jgi:hypothetical protein
MPARAFLGLWTLALVPLRVKNGRCIVWTDAALDEWLKDPQQVIPGTPMMFAGIKDARAHWMWCGSS